MTGCHHSWSGYFGTILRCRRCGSFTNTSAVAGESKPIFAPLKASNAKDDRAGSQP